MLPLSPEIIAAELSQTKIIIDKWLSKLEDGVPDPRDDNGRLLQEFVLEMCGELQLGSDKLGNISAIFAGAMS